MPTKRGRRALTVAVATILTFSIVAQSSSASAQMLPRVQVARRGDTDTLRCVLGWYRVSVSETHGIGRCHVDTGRLNAAKWAALAGTTYLIAVSDSRRHPGVNWNASTAENGWQGGNTAHCASVTGTVGTRYYFGPQTNATVGTVPANSFVYVCETNGPQPGVTWYSGQIAYDHRLVGGTTEIQGIAQVCPLGWANAQCDATTGGTMPNVVGTRFAWDGGAGYSSPLDWITRSMEIPESYPGLGEWPPNKCLGLRMFIPEPGRTIEHGGTLDVEFTAGWGALIAEELALLRYRWSPADPWITFYDAATSSSSPLDDWTFTNNTGGPRAGVTFEVECTRSGTAYIRGDNSAGSTTPQGSRACAALTMTWPDEGNYPGAESVGLVLNVAALGGTSITGLVVTGGRFGNVQSHTITSVTNANTITFADVDGTPQALPITTAGQYLTTFSFTDDWVTDDGLFLRCQDAAGYLNFQYKPPATVGKLPMPEGYGSRLEECVQEQTFGWRPSSWVPAFLNALSCVLQMLVVPIDSEFVALANATDQLTERTPFAQVVEIGGLLIGFFDDMPSSIDAHTGECLSLGGFRLAEPDGGEGPAPERVELCPDEIATPSIVNLRTLMGTAMWAGFAWNMISAIRRVMAS